MLGTDVGGGSSYTYTNYTMTYQSNKNFYQQIVTENFATTSGSRKWEFNADSYFSTWRSSGGETLSGYNAVIPPSSSGASAYFRASSGGSTAKMPATINGAKYYFRIAGIAGQNNYVSQNMIVMEANFTPNTLSSASHTVGNNTVSLGTPLNLGEYLYVRYSTTSNFASSNISLVSTSGTAGTFTVGNCGGIVYYYFYTSTVTPANINAAVTTMGQNAHDFVALNYLNNSGSNYSVMLSNPTPTISGSTSVCGGVNITLTGTPTVASGSSFNGANASNYSWSSSNTAAATVSTPVSTAVTVTGTTAGGSTTITYTIKDNFGCSGSGTYAITANPKPVIVSAIPAGTTCSHYPATINLTGLTPNSTFSMYYRVFSYGSTQVATGITSDASGNGNFQTINIPSNGTTSGLTPYQIFLDSIKNSTTTCLNNNIGINPLLTINRGPLPTISGSNSVCMGNTLSLTGTPNIQTGSFSSSSWISSNTGIATVNSSGLVTTVAAGNSIISFKVIDSHNCDSTATRNITVNANPTVSIAATESSCTNNDNKVLSGASVNLTASGSGGSGTYSTYTWDNSLGTGAIKTPIVTATTTYNVTVTDSNGCTGTNSKTETLITSPTVSIAATESSCTANDNKVLSGASVSLTASGSGGSGTYSTYTWDNSLGTGATKTPMVSATTTYNVTVTDSDGCTGTNAQTETLITVHTVSIATTENSCTANDNKVLSGATVSLMASGSSGSGTYSSYTWDNSLGTGTTKTPTVSATTTYNVTVTDSNGCTGTNAQTEILITAPSFSNTKIDDPCQIGVGSITVTLTGGTPTYTIAACGTTISPSPTLGSYVTVTGSPTTVASSGGSKTFSNLQGNAIYKFTITDTNGCAAQ